MFTKHFRCLFTVNQFENTAKRKEKLLNDRVIEEKQQLLNSDDLKAVVTNTIVLRSFSANRSTSSAAGTVDFERCYS